MTCVFTATFQNLTASKSVNQQFNVAKKLGMAEFEVIYMSSVGSDSLRSKLPFLKVYDKQEHISALLTNKINKV